MVVEIKASHMRTRQVCGPDRLQKDLTDNGVQVGVCRIKRIRKKLDIRCKQTKKFKTTTDSTRTLPVAENVLDQQFEIAGPNTAWVSDITYIPTDDAEIVGYAIRQRITKSFVRQSLFRAVAAKCPAKGLIHHSDRGSEYCAHEYRKLLAQFSLTVSISRKENCYDNAPMESFWGTLKQELVHHKRYRSRQEAIQKIAEYIEVFYNRQRRQKRLRYLSPVAYEQRFYAGQIAA